MEGTKSEALELQKKLNDRYTNYLEIDEQMLAEFLERETSLNASHFEIDERHQKAVDQLQAYIDDGERSLHVRSLFSSQMSNPQTASTCSKKQSSKRSSCSRKSNSDRLGEARIQAEMAKKNVKQQRLMQEAKQKKLDVEREATRRRLEFERKAAELEMALEGQSRQRSLLQEEPERQQKELDEEMETRRQIAEYEKLQTEVKIRERKELRSALGSDYESSDEERDDITQPKKADKAKPGFQSIEDQQTIMHKFLEELSKPKNVAEENPVSQKQVINWLDQSHATKRKPIVPFNTPAQPREGYVPQLDLRRDISETQFDNQKEMPVKSSLKGPLQQGFPTLDDSTSMQGRSDAALFTRVLQENRLPKPKMMTFDGDPKRYKLFMASFRNNVEARLEGDHQLKLTLLLDQCTGDAFELIEECVMLKPEQGYRTAIEKLECRFGESHLIARSYIDGVKKGGTIKPNDVKAFVKLADDMRNCQNVLRELRFSSDLDSTGTLENIMDRLPEHLQNQWVKRFSQILEERRDSTFNDLTLFVEQHVKYANSKFGHYLSQKRELQVRSQEPMITSTNQRIRRNKM